MTKRLFIALLMLIGCIAPGMTLIAQDQDATAGRIAWIGTDFNIYTAALGGELVQMTTDAGVSADGTTLVLYQMPTWSRDGRLAYFSSEVQRTGRTDLGVWVSADGIAEGVLRHRFNRDTFTYASWAPGNCAPDDSCRDLALLLSRAGANGFVVEVVRDGIETEEGENHRLIGRGVPFYFSWSPDASQMLWHRNNRRIDIYDLVQSQETRVNAVPGFFSAPAWSPVDQDALLYVVGSDEEGRSALVRAQGGVETRLADGLTGPVYFLWSPDGRRVAYTDQQGELYVIDALTGEMVTRTPESGVLAFFWSPDSERIAFLRHGRLIGSFDARAERITFAAQRQEIGIAWSILHLDDERIDSYAAFRPTQGLMYLLNYFDQFAQSHSLWSPDSRYLTYAEVLGGNREVVRVLDISSADDVPFTIAEGSLSIWSYR